ncbi:MAG: porin family protein [Prevotellaceae bacterium]|nr:porin family protein [Prevotellaceae bacterium]
MKNVFLKKMAITVIAAVLMNAAAFAQQKGDMAAGGNLLIGTGNNYTNLGIGAKFYYNVTNPVRLLGEFDAFFKSSNTSMWDLSVYGHYLFPIAEQIRLYPSVGLGLLGSTVTYLAPMGSNATGTYSDSFSDFALSLGGGVDYDLTANLILTGELRFKINDGSRLYIVAGLAYKF